jgi:RND family efflux transporter MFP subunit
MTRAGDRRNRRSRGATTSTLVTGVALAGLASLASVAWYINPFASSPVMDPGLVQKVVRGAFEHDIVERGELESSNNVLIRCEVQSRVAGSNGVKIIEIVPEGTNVKKGDFLVRFDDAALQSERTTQLINVGTAEAAAAQAQNDLETAVISRKEYEFGEFATESEKIHGEILVANQAVGHGQESVIHFRKMLRRGYVAAVQVRSHEYSLLKAQSDLRAAKVKLNSLLEYTKPKKISELDAKVKTCEAKLKSEEAKLALEGVKLKVLDEQIAKCLIHAPVDGQVIYDHERDDWGGAEYQIKQGAVVHEQRVVIRLPDPSKMQVVAKVAESRIDRIKPDMRATIEIEGLPGRVLQGKVTRVNEYPARENWFSANVKEYATTIEVLDPSVGLRPGMTAQVAIRVETQSDVLQVPVQAVVERNGTHYCARRSGSTVEVCKVEVGSTNEKFAVILAGLAAGDEVSMNPRSRLDAQLPEAEKTAQKKETPAPDADQLAAPHVPAGSGDVGP